MVNMLNREEQSVCNGLSGLSRLKTTRAFTLLEVMIAAGIFFMAVFAILSLVSTNIRNARLLQEQPVDPGMLLADLVQTNKLQEGSDSGDFGDLFPGYTWSSDITLVGSNGLFKVEYIVTKPGDGANSETSLSALLYRPDSPKSTP
jgi:Tfp pilus assembly protein PilV